MTIKEQSGRTLVEMLGILAVIGVLSLGGITGYDAATSRLQAKEIMDAAGKLYAIARTKSLESGSSTDTATLYDLDLNGKVVGECASEIIAYPSGIVVVKGCSVGESIEGAVEKIAGAKYCSTTKSQKRTIILNMTHTGSDQCRDFEP